jgi:hypothetical protein
MNTFELPFIVAMSKFDSVSQGQTVLLRGGVEDGGVVNMREYNKHAKVRSGG